MLYRWLYGGVLAIALGSCHAPGQSQTPSASAQEHRGRVDFSAYPVAVYVPYQSAPFADARTTVFVVRDFEWNDWRRRFAARDNYQFAETFALVDGADRVVVRNDEVAIIVIGRAVAAGGGAPSQLVLQSIDCDSSALSLAFLDRYPDVAQAGVSQEQVDEPAEHGVTAQAWVVVLPRESAPFHWADSEVRGFGVPGRRLRVDVSNEARVTSASERQLRRGSFECD